MRNWHVRLGLAVLEYVMTIYNGSAPFPVDEETGTYILYGEVTDLSSDLAPAFSHLAFAGLFGMLLWPKNWAC